MNIKYIGEDGTAHYLNSFTVNNVTIAQVKGQSEDYVMSQKAVTDEIAKLQQSIDDIDVSEQLKDYALKTELPDAYDDTQVKSDIKDIQDNKADKTELEVYASKTEMVESDDEIKQSIEDLREELKTIDCGEY